MGKRQNGTIIVLGMGAYPYLLRGIKGYKISVSLKPLTDNAGSVKLVVFTGGEDVCPKLYGGLDRGVSIYSVRRDGMEAEIFKVCAKHGIKMVGICRGLQFLNVMAGGQLWQHINHHNNSSHAVHVPAIGTTITVNSFHHQMVALPSGATPLLWAHPRVATFGLDPRCVIHMDVKPEIEGAVYPEINAFGVQYHPELMDLGAPGRNLFLNMLNSFLSMDTKQFAVAYGERLDYGRSENH